MSDAPEGPRPADPGQRPAWVERNGRNVEAIEYYRQRSKAPGVAEGGAERNFYCMKCDGVIPFDGAPESCPHCGEPIDEHVKRYFNWVEINEPPQSDVKALLPWIALGGLVVLGVVAWIATLILS
jgi:hypothetical protein